MKMKYFSIWVFNFVFFEIPNEKKMKLFEIFIFGYDIPKKVDMLLIIF